jgi:hypothetical protein
LLNSYAPEDPQCLRAEPPSFAACLQTCVADHANESS